MLTIERTIGRLVEVRFSGNPTVAEMAEWTRACEACLKTCLAQTKKEAVCLTDLRASALFSPAVTDQLIEVMKTDNRALARNAILLTGGAIFTLQLQRMFRESSGGDRRRLFTNPTQAIEWLSEVLVGVERARLQKFVQEYDLLADVSVGSPRERAPRRSEPPRARTPTEIRTSSGIAPRVRPQELAESARDHDSGGRASPSSPPPGRGIRGGKTGPT